MSLVRKRIVLPLIPTDIFQVIRPTQNKDAVLDLTYQQLLSALSDVFSEGGSLILLKTNGTDNPNQNILNLVAGTGVTLDVNDQGDVTINSFGGSFITSITDTTTIDLDVTSGVLTGNLVDVGTAGVYGHGTQVPQVTIDSKGRVTNVTLVPIVSGAGTVTVVGVNNGPGINATISGNPNINPTINITNTAPDVVVGIAGGPSIGVSGTYPNFTIRTNVTASQRLLGRYSAGAGVYEEIALGTGFSFSGNTLNFSGGGGGGSVTSVFGRTGVVIAVSGDYTTTLVTEGTNLYFTDARAIAALLTGYVSGAGTISASDSILTAIQKLNGNIGALVTGVSSVNSGININVDNTNPAAPIINSLADRYKTSSVTSNSVSNGSKSFAVDINLSYIPLQEILVVHNPANHMHGEVTSYNAATGALVVDIKNHTGSGTYTSWVINLDGTPVDAITGSGTTNEIAYFTAARVIASLPVATYPSLTELSYVKGVTSAIQTQINNKLSTTLNNTNIFVGNISNVATGVAMSGDIGISNAGLTTIANNAVTYAKMQAVSATSRLLGSNDSTTPVQEITLGTGLTIVGSTLTPNGSGSLFDLVIAVSDETTPLTTGAAKITFRMPRAVTLTAVRASLGTAQGAGIIFTVDINENGVSILSTKITIDNNELTSTTAATPPVISDVNLADDAQITVDVDQVGDGTARGLKIYLIGNYV